MTTAVPSRRHRALRGDGGFTLVELLVVVVILGILAAVAVPTLLDQRERAWETAVRSDLRNVAVAAEVHFSENNTYTGFDPVLLRTTGSVVLVDVTATAAGYCLDGSHANVGAVVLFHLDSTDGVVSPGAC